MNRGDQTEQQEQAPQRHSTPTESEHLATLLVGSVDGTVALLRARSGVTVWRSSSRREVGTLAHDGAHCYVALGSYLRNVQSRRGESPEQRRRRFERLQAQPASLEARGAHDGNLLWRRADLGLIGRLDVGAEAGGAVVVGSTSIYGERALYGLDVPTGATLWTYPTTGNGQINGHRFAVRGGRVYLYGEGGARGRGLSVLDVRTGQRLWQRDVVPELVISPRGHTVVEQRWQPDDIGSGGAATLDVLDPATDVARQQYNVHGAVRAVTDAGMAVLSTSTFDAPGLAALRLEDGRELWRVDDALAYQLAVTDATVYCARLLAPGIGEVEALEAGSGHCRWRWRTPGDLRALLRLWGARTPWVAASSGMLVGKSLAEVLAQPSPRDLGIALWREFENGQWRHPHTLHGAINAMWLAADTRAAYLGTRLGVFALGADDGRLLWHALPITDLSFLTPALPPA